MADPMRAFACLLASTLALALAAPASAADDLSSGRDYSDNAQRDRPIACKEGDIVAYPGMTMGELFGADWPAQPEPAAGGTHSPAETLERGRMEWPRGLDRQETFVVVAVLVGTDGQPLRAEVICSTRQGFDKVVRRSAMESTYAPARVDGKPVVSVVARVEHFRPVQRSPRRLESPVSGRPARP
jgi:hypothetical protein